MELSLSPDLAPIPSTLNKSTTTPFQLEARVTSTFNPYEITEESYKAMLMKHKKRRTHGEVRIIKISILNIIFDENGSI